MLTALSSSLLLFFNLWVLLLLALITVAPALALFPLTYRGGTKNPGSCKRASERPRRRRRPTSLSARKQTSSYPPSLHSLAPRLCPRQRSESLAARRRLSFTHPLHRLHLKPSAFVCLDAPALRCIATTISHQYILTDCFRSLCYSAFHLYRRSETTLLFFIRFGTFGIPWIQHLLPIPKTAASSISPTAIPLAFAYPMRSIARAMEGRRADLQTLSAVYWDRLVV